MVQYTVKPEKAAKIKAAVVKFVRGTKKEKGTLHYDAYQATDRTFVHIMTFLNSKSEKIHASSPNTKQFTRVLYPNCIEKPKFTKLRLVRKRK